MDTAEGILLNVLLEGLGLKIAGWSVLRSCSSCAATIKGRTPQCTYLRFEPVSEL